MRRVAASAPLLVTVVVLAALWVTNAGSVPFISGGPGDRRSPHHALHTGPAAGRGTSPRRAHTGGGVLPFEIAGYILLGAFVLAVLVFVVTAAWSNRRDPREKLVEAPTSLDAIDALMVPVDLVQTTEQQLRAVRQGSPRNAIVACWWELERSSEATGLPRAASETSSEFTQRVLGRYVVDATAIESLAGLYREARFSVHLMTEDDRERAVAALETILERISGPVGWSRPQRPSAQQSPAERSWADEAMAEAGLRCCLRVAVTIGFAVFTERHPHPLALGAAVVATMTVAWLCLDAFQDTETPQWSLYRAPAPARTFDPRFSRLSQELNEATDRRAASIAVHSSLGAVADRILLDKYDVDREHDPDAAREILGPQVASYLDSTPGVDKVVFSPQIFAVLDRLESL